MGSRESGEVGLDAIRDGDDGPDLLAARASRTEEMDRDGVVADLERARASFDWNAADASSSFATVPSLQFSQRRWS